jgi:hypothetical protein
MLIVGVTIIISSEPSTTYIIEGITKNLPLISLIIVVPLLSIPILIGNYHEAISEFTLRYARKPNQIFLFISGIFFVLAPILNIGSIHVVHSMVNNLKLPNSFLGRIYVRGVLSASTWAPYFASVFLVLYFYNIPLYDYLFYGLLLGVLQVFISYFLFTFSESKTIPLPTFQETRNGNSQKLIEILTVLILLTLTIFLSELLSTGDIIIMITITVIICTFLWCIYLRKVQTFKSELILFVRNILPSRANEIVLFLSAGFFGFIVSSTTVGELLNILWIRVAEESILLVIFATMIFISFLSFLGIHQIVTVSIILSSISNEAVGINNITMSLILLSAYAVGGTISPIAPANVVVANLLKINVYTLILKWNLIYAVSVTGILSLVILIIYNITV